MARYFNKFGAEIEEAEWQRLVRDPAYHVLRRRYVRSNRTWVEATWLGYWAACEPRPLMFYVEHYRWLRLDRGQERKEEIKYGFRATERDAVETAKRWESE